MFHNFPLSQERMHIQNITIIPYLKWECNILGEFFGAFVGGASAARKSVNVCGDIL
jgi:hypothetical protein